MYICLAKNFLAVKKYQSLLVVCVGRQYLLSEAFYTGRVMDHSSWLFITDHTLAVFVIIT